MKNIKNMAVKELREVAKELNISGRWDMNKGQLIDAIEKAHAAIKAKTKKVKTKKETSKANAMKVQRAFIKVGDARKEAYRYITITVKNMTEDEAAKYIGAVCAKMTELDKEFECDYLALNCPDINDEIKSYTDMISFEKVAGKIAIQRQYVGKLMTKAMASIKEGK